MQDRRTWLAWLCVATLAVACGRTIHPSRKLGSWHASQAIQNKAGENVPHHSKLHAHELEEPSQPTLRLRRKAIVPIREVAPQDQLDNFCANIHKPCNKLWTAARKELPQISYGEFYSDNKEVCADPDTCRVKFVKHTLKHTVELFFGAHALDVSSKSLGSQNVVLQAGTAVWYYGCRGATMTNDIDAWLMPEPGFDLTFNVADHSFVWGTERIRDDVIEKKPAPSFRMKTPPVLRREEDAEDDSEVSESTATPLEETDGVEIGKLESIPEAKWVRKKGLLSRFEVHRNGRMFFYLTRRTKNPTVVRPPEHVGVFRPWANGDFQYTPMEYDMYTPYGAMDGDYTWPWVETNKIFKRIYESGADLPEVNVVPRYLVIVQKIKLYLDSLPRGLELPENINDEHVWHMRAKREDGQSDEVYLGSNFEKLVQDILDLQCLCRQCDGGEFESPFFVPDESSGLLRLTAAPNFCYGLCGLVKMVGYRSDDGVVPLPARDKLYAMFNKRFEGHDSGLKNKHGVLIQRPQAAVAVQLPETINDQLLFMYQQAHAWQVNEHFKAGLMRYAKQCYELLNGDSTKLFEMLHKQ